MFKEQVEHSGTITLEQLVTDSFIDEEIVETSETTD